MLWNEIYSFYIRYVFGGVIWAENGNTQSPTLFGGILGNAVFYNLAEVNTTLFDRSISLGNYFSLIATLISIVVILVLCCALIKKIYNMCAHIIG